MGYAGFLSSLLSEGRVTVPPLGPLTDEQLHAGDAVLSDFERHWRLDMPGRAPPFSVPAAQWAGTRFYHACQFTLYRDADEKLLEHVLGTPWDGDRTLKVHYSVDIVFRYLGDLLKFARSAAEKDPLIDYLRRWCREWPLSSVGVAGLGEVAIDGLAESPTLMRLYADRVIAVGDVSRLADTRAREAVRAALGIHEDLAPGLCKALQQYEVQGTPE